MLSPTQRTTLPKLQWASSKTNGRITEIAVMAPVLLGLVPGERRTYEERLATVIDGLQARVEQGLPNVLNLVPSIHFGRITLIRPEQYLLGSTVADAQDAAPAAPTAATTKATREQAAQGPTSDQDTAPPLLTPKRLDPYRTLNPLTNDELKELLQQATSGGQPPGGAQPTNAPGAPDAAVLAQLAAKVGNLKSRPQQPDRKELRSFLLTTVEFDGDLKVYFRDIALFFNKSFDQLFANCEEYPGTENFESFWKWILRYQINTQLFYCAYPQLSVVRIKQLELFKRRFDDFVAKVRCPTAPRERSLDELFDAFLKENQQIAYGFPAPGGTYQPDGNAEGSL